MPRVHRLGEPIVILSIAEDKWKREEGIFNTSLSIVICSTNRWYKKIFQTLIRRWIHNKVETSFLLASLRLFTAQLTDQLHAILREQKDYLTIRISL